MSIGPIMADLSGTALTPAEKEWLQHPAIGGVILFTRNFHSLEQLQALVQSIRQCRTAPLLIAVDHEGGRVQRFQEGFTRLPSASLYGELYENDPEDALQLAKSAAWIMASELLTLGIDLSFAPCLDLNYGVSQVIGDRSFHLSPEIVTQLGIAFGEGMREAGMQSTAKHFPGHGGVSEDSHTHVPIDSRPFKEIAATDLLPFKNMIKHNLAAVMPAHVVYSSCDNVPVGFSSYWLQEILRQQLNFKGAILSDDLSMAGASELGAPFQRAEKALSAGCDMILICNNQQAVIETLDKLKIQSNKESQIRLERLQGEFKHNRAWLYQNKIWQETRERLASVCVCH